MKATAEKPPASVGVIEGNKSYPLPMFMQLSGIGVWGMRQARRAGLRVVPVGRRKFVLGSDWLDYLAKQAEQST